MAVEAMDVMLRLADRWDFVLLMAGLGLMAFLLPWRRRLTGLAFCAFAFLLRKLLLFIPVCGAISTADRVVFWSGGAYGFFLLAFWGAVLSIAIIRALREEEGAAFGILFADAVAFLICSGLLLPVDGWCHLYMPALGFLALPKILLVSPILRWACWGGLVVHAALLTTRNTGIRHAANSALVGVILLAGTGSFFVQACQWIPGANVTPLIETVRATQPRNTEEGGSPQAKETGNFLRLWRSRLAHVQQSGINLVEKEVPPARLNPMDLRIPAPTLPIAFSPLVAGSIGMLLLTLIIEQARRGNAVGPSANLPVSHAAAMDTADQEMLVKQAMPVLLARMSLWHGVSPKARSALLLIPFAFGAAGAFGPLLFQRLVRGETVETIADVLFGVAAYVWIPAMLAGALEGLSVLCLLPRYEFRLRAFFAGDRQGTVAPTKRFIALLGHLAGDREIRKRLLTGQPPGVLVRCLLDNSADLRQAALLLLPENTSAGEITVLAASEHSDARVAAAMHPSCPREVRLRLLGDTDSHVRAEAMKRLSAATSTELESLMVSSFQEVRQFALAQPAMTQAQFLYMAGQDRDANLRKAAQSRLGPLSDSKLDLLLKSSFQDVRAFAIVSQPAVTQTQLLKMAAEDQDLQVRQAAQGKLQPLSSGKLDPLIRSQFRDVRQFALNQREITQAQLLHIAGQDRDAELRKTAQNRLLPLSTGQMDPLLKSGFQDVRAFAIVSQPAITQSQLLKLAVEDQDLQIRQAAQHKLQPLSPGELDPLIRSGFQDVREFALAQPRITQAQLLYMADQNGAREIWQQLASHKSMPAAKAAELISRFLPRSRYVVDVPAEGYDSSDSTGTTWIETRAEEGHNEYDGQDIALARQIIRSVPERSQALMEKLRDLNHELFNLIGNI